MTLDCELTFQAVASADPVVNVENGVAKLHEAADDAGDAEVETGVQLDIHYILVPWQDVAYVSFLHEVDARDVVALEEHVLVLQLDERLL